MLVESLWGLMGQRDLGDLGGLGDLRDQMDLREVFGGDRERESWDDWRVAAGLRWVEEEEEQIVVWVKWG